MLLAWPPISQTKAHLIMEILQKEQHSTLIIANDEIAKDCQNNYVKNH